MAKWLIADGYNLAFRAFYGMPELNRSDGLPTNMIHGWVRTFWKLEDDESPDHVAVCFDLGGDRRREEMLPDYKANRSEPPEGFEEQIPWVKDLTRAMGYAVIEREGIEADDLLAVLARDLVAEGHTVGLVSADKDLGQCVGDGVLQLVPPPTANPRLGWRRLDASGVESKFGVRPDQIPDYLAIVGDTSDNIPGIPGVGPKTAAKWLGRYGNLEGILEHTGEIKPQRFQQVVHELREDLRRNLVMTTVYTDMEVTLPDLPPVDIETLVALLEKLEMSATARKARERAGGSPG